MKFCLLITISLFTSHSFLAEASNRNCVQENELNIPEIRQIQDMRDIHNDIFSFLKTKGFWGKYYVKQVCGSRITPKIEGFNQKIIPLNYTLSEPTEIVEFKINKESEGTISGNRSCRDIHNSNINDLSSQGALLRARVVTSLPSIAFYWYKQFNLIVDSTDCQRDGVRRENLGVKKATKLFSGQLKRLPGNKGFYNPTQSPNYSFAKERCAFLFHSTFVKINNKIACIGYPNTNLSEIEILTIDESLHLTRTTLRQKHNFNEYKALDCHVPKNRN